jgi:hypothetical protein
MEILAFKTPQYPRKTGERDTLPNMKLGFRHIADFF